MKVKVFVDSSVLFAATLSSTGAASELLKYGFLGAVDLSFSNYVFVEVERDLWRKRPDKIDVFRFIQGRITNVINPPADLVRTIAQSIEPEDAPIVAAAITAGAEYLVSHDQKHLLSKQEEINTAFHIIVARPDEVLAIIRTES